MSNRLNWPLAMTFHLMLRHAITVNDLVEVHRLAEAHPDWPSLPRTAFDQDPLMLICTTYPDPNDGPVRERLVEALIRPLTTGALRGSPQGLSVAVINGWDSLVERLLPLSDPNEHWRGQAALHHAVERLSVPMVKRLLPHADLNGLNDEGMTPLMVLARTSVGAMGSSQEHRAREIVDAILNDPRLRFNQATPDGHTALAFACCLGADNPWLVKALLERGADPNTQDTNGTTPFMYVLRSIDRLPGIQSLLAWWLEFDAASPVPGDPSSDRPRLNLLLRDTQGQSCMDLARLSGVPHLVRELQARAHRQESNALRTAVEQIEGAMTKQSPANSGRPSRVRL